MRKPSIWLVIAFCVSDASERAVPLVDLPPALSWRPERQIESSCDSMRRIESEVGRSSVVIRTRTLRCFSVRARQ